MSALLRSLLLAVVAAALAIALHSGRGTVVALVPPLRIDASVNLVLIVLLLVLWGAYRLGRMAQRAHDFPERVRAYRERRSELGALRGLREALRALFEGRFARAERAAMGAQSVPSVAALAALVGARAAHRMQEFARREEWLERARRDPELATARLVSSAEMWSEQRESGRALQVIEQLHGAGARHIHAMRIALNAHLQSHHWREALRIVRMLEKHRGLPAAAINASRVRAYRGLTADSARDPVALQRLWEEIPEGERRVPELVLAVAEAFREAGRLQAAAHVLEEILDHQWHDQLLESYARCAAGNVGVAITRLEDWMQERGRDAQALLCLGRICLAASLWGKARLYLEECQRGGDNPDASLALAELADAVEDAVQAAHWYRRAARGLVARAQAAPRAEAARLPRLRRESLL